ncbi:amidohydrolase [Aureimonas fodinaquatilis]|uniref:Amidohydrolase n=1 Tax=Aureimonas fodinaquatilis TaxID=2565783 RepID=A0A5B0DWX8_9HYPH|nr:amidohydrolase family protein [Aureimonas fodinaquatilis]KAA0970365.1 amidohydrolase [Aureimonas fodinaquatilis]
MQIVDARVRPPISMFTDSKLYEKDFLHGFRKQAGYGHVPHPDSSSIDIVLDEMRSNGVIHGVVPGRAINPTFGGGDQNSLKDLIAGSDGYLTGLVAADAASISDVGAFIDGVLKDGFKGITVESALAAGHHPVDHQSNFPIYEAAQSAGLVTYIMGGGSAGPDIGYSDPVFIDRVAENFPDLKIVAVHGGYPHVQEICGVVFRRANVWVLPDLYFPGLPGEADYLALARTFGQERVIFGTAYPVSPHGEHIKRYLDLPITDALKERILARNTIELFGLDL